MISPMEAAPDSFTVAEAAKILGLSPKRVRQLVAQGGLPVIEGTSPLRLPSVDVLALRERRGRREGAPRPGPQGTPQLVSLPDVLALAQSITQRAIAAADESHSLVLQARDRVEDHLKAELAHARQQVDQLRPELDGRIRTEHHLRTELAQVLHELGQVRAELDQATIRRRPWWLPRSAPGVGAPRRAAG